MGVHSNVNRSTSHADEQTDYSFHEMSTGKKFAMNWTNERKTNSNNNNTNDYVLHTWHESIAVSQWIVNTFGDAINDSKETNKNGQYNDHHNDGRIHGHRMILMMESMHFGSFFLLRGMLNINNRISVSHCLRFSAVWLICFFRNSHTFIGWTLFVEDTLFVLVIFCSIFNNSLSLCVYLFRRFSKTIHRWMALFPQ